MLLDVVTVVDGRQGGVPSAKLDMGAEVLPIVFVVEEAHGNRGVRNEFGSGCGIADGKGKGWERGNERREWKYYLNINIICNINITYMHTRPDIESE